MKVDIRLNVGFLDHPKVVKLTRRCGDKVIFALIQLWLYAAQYRTKGVLHGMDAEDIALVARWEGDPEKFIADLLELRWLDQLPGGEIVIHEWEHHQSWVFRSEERSQDAKKSVQKRWEKERKSKDRPKKNDTGRIRTEYDPNTSGNTPFPSSPLPPSPSPDQDQKPITKAREKKPPAPPPSETEEAYFSRVDEFFRAVGNGKLDEWVMAYPDVLVEEELLRAKVWLKGNPEQRKKNLRRFIVAWLARAQEKGGAKDGRRTQSRDGEHRETGVREKYAGR